MDDIEQIIQKLSKKVDSYSTNTGKPFIENIKSSIQNPLKINLISICIFIFFLIIFFLYFIKPDFIISEIKNDNTFFIEYKVNYKYIVIISIILTAISAYLLNMINKKFHLFLDK